jgi:processive rubber oxygenase RoxA-like protein
MQERAAPIDDDTASQYAARWRRRFLILLALILVPFLALLAYGLARFGGDTAVVYDNITEHFKYGSTGGEHESGFPYWIFQALPQVCAHRLPGGYRSLGFVYEEGKTLPIGMSQRRYTGIDRTFLNCAVCHTSTVRESPQAKPQIILGMPANTFDVMGFERFLFECAGDPQFSAEFIVPEARRLRQAQGEDLDLIDRYLVYPLAIAIMRDRLLMLRGRFSFVLQQAEHGLPWGPGRVDTFNSAKVLFNFPMDKLDPSESLGASDFPSIWNQRKKKGMQLHWDGNNTMVEERNKSAAFGTGTTPPTIDLEAIGRIEDWLLDLKPPPYPFPIDAALAARGAPVYKEYCAGCHGASGQDFSGEKVGKVTPIEEVGTDRRRLDSYTYTLAVNQSTLYAGYPHRFQHFRKTFGYANMPLDGLWLRAPYLHNGSVPTLRDLLEPAANRPKVFYRGYDVYDQKNVGFVSTVADEQGRQYFKYDATAAGNSNAGHEGRAYGTLLPAAEKAALLEYLKTF